MTTQATASDQNAFVGIDFGTTKTMVASYDPGKKSAKPLTFGRGKFEKPTSMYATETGDLLFGDDADDEGITDLPNHIRRFKMKLGKPGLACVGRKSGTAQQLTTEFLANLRSQLENQVLHSSVDRVILTVPAMFGPAQRHDLTEAARHAGFSHVELLEEPVAAGIAYCDHQSDLSKELRFIVVDWGGGTFDVAHLEKSAWGEIKVHEDFIVGRDDIGGEAFDDKLWGIASSALDSAGRGTLDSQSREHWGRYRRDLSRAKETLSSQTSVSMTFTPADGSPAKVTLNRADFNNIISPMIQEAASFVSQLITRARNAGCPPEFILLAGGTSRIPLIAEELERITGVKCRQWSDGREAIALGAAIRAHQVWGGRFSDVEEKRTPPPSANLSKEEYELMEKVKILAIDGRFDEAFSIITGMLIHQPSDDVFFLWNEVAISVPDGEAVLARAREVHAKRGFDFWGSACVAASLAGIGRFQEAENTLHATEKSDTATALFLKTLNPDDVNHQSDLNVAFQKYPNHPWFLADQASKLHDKGEYDAGIEMVRRAVTIAPFSLSCRLELLMMILNSDDSSEKIDHVRIMERISPKAFASRLGRLLWLIRTDPSHSQINELIGQIMRDPRVESTGKSGLASCHVLRARLRDPEKEKKQILEDLNQAIAICPNHVEARTARGEVLNILERSAEAMKDFDAALASDPKNIEARLAKADCLMWKIDHVAAVMEYKYAFSQEPANIDAKSGLILSILYKHFRAGVLGSAYLAPEIPDEKRVNAISSYGNSSILEDFVFFLWDRTFWGSARKGLMIGINGVAFHDEKGALGIKFQSMLLQRGTHSITITGKGIPSKRSIFIRVNDNELRILNLLYLALSEIMEIKGI